MQYTFCRTNVYNSPRLPLSPLCPLHSESDLFTSTLDMVSTLLSWMNSDFLLVPMATGDEGKKTTVSIIRKLKVLMSPTLCYLFTPCFCIMFTPCCCLFTLSCCLFTPCCCLFLPPTSSPSYPPCRVTLQRPSPPVCLRSDNSSPSLPRCWR